MKTVVLGPPPAELQALIERRQGLGLDIFDEVWDGSYHVAAALSATHALVDNVLAVLLHPLARSAGLTGTGPFNLGRPNDYRVPDRGYHRGHPTGTWVPSAAIIVEIISADDETYEKLDFYAAHGVEEIVVADPGSRSITIWRQSSEASFQENPVSAILGVSAADLAAAMTWPDALD